MNKDKVIKELENINEKLHELMFKTREFEVSEKIVRLFIKVDETIKAIEGVDITILK